MEVLVVVVIAVSVAAFAVPAYKKTQDRNRYTSALGVLINVGSGLRTLQQEVTFTYPTASTIIGSTWQTTDLDNDANITSSNANVALFARKYMAPIPFDKGNSYKGYYFAICPENGTSSLNCCSGLSGAVACMKDSSCTSRPTKGQYCGAVYLKDGSITRISK